MSATLLLNRQQIVLTYFLDLNVVQCEDRSITFDEFKEGKLKRFLAYQTDETDTGVDSDMELFESLQKLCGHEFESDHEFHLLRWLTSRLFQGGDFPRHFNLGHDQLLHCGDDSLRLPEFDDGTLKKGYILEYHLQPFQMTH